MSQPIKFIQEELDHITKLRDEHAQKISEFGQVELEILLTNQRLEALNIAKDTLQKDYIKLQTEEQELVSTLNKKYGAGQVDLASGEFIPVK
tara:strand:+ start:604 stop:879 length:276 start_codon:yes stop_codon:yes gene_type:complete